MALIAGLLSLAGSAFAQVSTATVRGVVTDKDGPVPGATVTATRVDSGFVYPALTSADGSFNVLVAPGLYDIKVAAQSYVSASKRIEPQVGQTLEMKFILSPDNLVVENVTVVGTQVLETRTPEVATNVSKQQIQDLPQGQRNFVDFAALAPGVGTSVPENTERYNTFRSGSQDARQVNVFVDGLSYKNDILKGGAFMQDNSHGNPFPLSAVQEFRVLTQNYKAEYEKAAAAIVTAVTKSGGNEWHGDVQYFYQNKDMRSQEAFADAQGLEKPDYKQWQGAVSVGGPIIKDKLHIFASYEQNEQDRFNLVTHGGDWNNPDVPDAVRTRLSAYQTGQVLQPFHEKLFFTKLTWQPKDNQTLDASFSLRNEYERQGFGGQRVFEGAENFKVKTYAAVVKHQWNLGRFINEASLDWQKLEWNPTALNPNTPHENFIGLLDIGGKDTSGDRTQDKIGLRDVVTYTTNWNGRHVLKGGVTANFMKYDITNALNANPIFNYRNETANHWETPFEAFYGYGDPSVKFNNRQYGIFIQDDWSVLPNLEFNLGLRWDYESNMLNNDYRTPPELITALEAAQRTYSDGVTVKLSDAIDLNRYTTNGSNRNAYSGMLQPRLGFSWDVFSTGKTVVFGGLGRYFDRVNLDDIYSEQQKLTWKTYHFCFGTNTGCGTEPIAWDPTYLSAAGLQGLIDRGVAPGPEVWLLANDTKPPYSDQWTLGLRQAFGDWLGTLSYNNVRGYNGLTWFLGNTRPGTTNKWGDWIPVEGYGAVLISDTSRRTWYDGWFLSFDKPYTNASRWGFNLAYTYADAKQYGRENHLEGTAFGFDYNSPAEFTQIPSDNVESNHLVMSGTVGLPWQIKASGIITLGSGLPFTIYDASQGWDKFQNRWNAGTPEGHPFLGIGSWAYRSVDTRFQKDINVGRGQTVGITVEGFNVFNYTNPGCFGWSEGFIGPGGVKDPKFGLGACQLNPRRVQVGAAYHF